MSAELVLRAAVLLVLAVAVALAVVAARSLARHRLGRLRTADPERLLEGLTQDLGGRPGVIAFSSPTCGICRSAQAAALERLRALAPELSLVKVDVADRPDLARRFGILTVPATIVVSGGGEVLAANQGFASAQRLLEQISAI